MADERGVAELSRPVRRAKVWSGAFFGRPAHFDSLATAGADAQHFRYCAFLSYGHRDADKAHWLHESCLLYTSPSPRD